jgi:hypothetical protein
MVIMIIMIVIIIVIIYHNNFHLLSLIIIIFIPSIYLYTSNIKIEFIINFLLLYHRDSALICFTTAFHNNH